MKFMVKQFAWCSPVRPKREKNYAKFLRLLPAPGREGATIDSRYPNTVVLARMTTVHGTEIFHSHRAWSDPESQQEVREHTGYTKRYGYSYNIYGPHNDLIFLEGIPVCRKFLATERSKIEKALRAELLLSLRR